jgi:cobalamin synthase
MTIRRLGIFVLLFFTIIAWILSMTANMDGAELGAIFNLIFPPFVGLISGIIFLLICWLAKGKAIRIFALSACCLYLLYVGLIFQLRPGYLPFPF